MMAGATETRARATRRAWRPLLTTFSCVVMAACGDAPGSAEDEIRAWVDRGHEAAEARDRDELVDMISPTYADGRGNSRDDMENMFRYYFLRTKKVGLLVSVDDIEIFDRTAAEVMLTVGMGATTNSSLGFNADAYRFALELENDGDGWLLVSGRWSEFGDELQ